LNCYSFTVLFYVLCAFVTMFSAKYWNTGILCEVYADTASSIGRCLAGGQSWRLIAAVGGKTRPICSCQFYLPLLRKPAKSFIRRSSPRSRTKKPDGQPPKLIFSQFLDQELISYRYSFCSCCCCWSDFFKKPKAPLFQIGSE